MRNGVCGGQSLLCRQPVSVSWRPFSLLLPRAALSRTQDCEIQTRLFCWLVLSSWLEPLGIILIRSLPAWLKRAELWLSLHPGLLPCPDHAFDPGSDCTGCVCRWLFVCLCFVFCGPSNLVFMSSGSDILVVFLINFLP